MTGMIQAYMSGDVIERPPASIIFIGESASLGGVGLAINAESGELYYAKSGAPVGKRASPVPLQPKAYPGRLEWVQWGISCFEATPSLGADDRMANPAEENPNS